MYVMFFLNERQFQKTGLRPHHSISREGAEGYEKIYPSSSHPSLFFGLAKVHQVPNNLNNVADLPLFPVIANNSDLPII